MPRILEDYEYKLLKRVLYVFTSLFALLILFALVLQTIRGEKSGSFRISFIIRSAFLLVHLGFIALLVSGVLNKSRLAAAGLIMVAVNFLITRYTQFSTVQEFDLSLVHCFTSVSYILIFGIIIRRTYILIIMSALFFVCFYIVFVKYPLSFFLPWHSTVAHHSALVLISLFFMIQLMVFSILNHYVQTSLYRNLENSRDYLKKLAFFDQETGLMNGLGLEYQLENIFSRLDIPRDIGVLAGIRFEGIAELNEQYGYHVTSEWLVNFSAELAVELERIHKENSAVNQSFPFSLYRPESSIFVFPVVVVKGDAEGVRIPKNILSSAIQDLLNRSEMGSKLRFIGAFSVYPEDADAISDLQRNVINILHEAGSSDYSRFIPFNAAAFNQYLQRQMLRDYMRQPGFEQYISAWFQPKINIETGLCVGFEALARWHHPELGSVSPKDFIPIAEETGAILPLTKKILQDTRNLIGIFNASERPHPVRISFNLSPAMIVPEILGDLESWIKENGMENNLEVEITEGIMLKSTETIQKIFQSWRNIGIHFSIDDFGTGYSNLSYLQSFEADVLKIDKRFIDGLPGDRKNVSLVKAIILMARAFGMRTIAEGVENEEQAAFLKNQGCDEIQGYLYSKPLNFDSATEYCQSYFPK